MRALPALQSIHELAGGLQTFTHHMCLLPYHEQGILQESSLVLDGRGSSHCAPIGHLTIMLRTELAIPLPRAKTVCH